MNGNFLLQIPIFSDDELRSNVGKSIQFEVVPIPTPFDNIAIMGNKTNHIFRVENDLMTPSTKMTATLKYDGKTEL